MTNPAHSLLGRHGPAITLLILLAVIGIGIDSKSSTAKIPPFFDSLSYYTKSKRVWEQLHHGWSLRKTLNAEPVVRPPGCALIGYPFGFSPDYRGFYFRTVFFPIAMWMLALWMIAQHAIPPGPNRWTAACLIGGFASFSMFYHFDFNPALDETWGFCHTWGMQDCVLASLSALATALVFLSARKQSIGLAFAGGIVGAWTLLIKPSGMLVMALVFWTWLIETGIRRWPVNHAWKNDRAFRRYAISAGSMLVLVFASLLVVCIRSKYLSPENWKYMSAAVTTLYASLPSSFSPKVLNSWIFPALGWHWFLFLAVVVFLLAVRRLASLFCGRWQAEDCRFPAALLGFAGGMYWWLFMAGQQVRYLFPFILVFLTAIFPDLIRLTGRLRPWSRGLLRAASITPAILVSGLVLAGQSSIPLQRAIGISATVTNDEYKDELKIGEALVTEAHTREAPVIVYSLDAGVSAGIIHGVGEMANLAAPDKPGVHWYFAFDWTRGALLRRTDLLNSEYIIFRPTGNAKASLVSKGIGDWNAESQVFAGWFEKLDGDAGVHVLVRNSLCLLRIVDKQKLNTAFEKLMSEHQWRELFVAENSLSSRSSLPQQFGASRDVLFHASSAQDAVALNPNAAISSSHPAGSIILRPPTGEPGLHIPDLELRANSHLIVRICLDSPSISVIEIRYASENGSRFGALQTVWKEVFKGSNELYVLVPLDGGHLRISFHSPQDLPLRDIELRAIPNR